MFAYREVPRATTSYSPFELVYARDVRDPLDVQFKGRWTRTEESPDDIANYVTRIHEWMKDVSEIVQQQIQQVQEKQKEWYDYMLESKIFNQEIEYSYCYQTVSSSSPDAGEDLIM